MLLPFPVMRYAYLAAALAWAGVAAENAKPPERLVFPSKAGRIVFNHAAHVKSQDGKCGACHDSLWLQSAKEPPRNSDGCRTCHQANGAAFEMKGNCKRCHQETSAGQEKAAH